MLCCIGDLVEDVVVWPSAEPVRGTDTASRIFRQRGGSAATVAVYAATTGVASRFIGQVGDDRLGSMLVAEMEASGVDTKVHRAGTTGSIIVLVDAAGERTMLPDRGAAMELSALPDGALDGATWLHVPTYSLVVEPLGGISVAAIALARQMTAAVSIDASSTGPLSQYGVDRFLALMAEVEPDVFFCNKDEAELLEIEQGRPLPGAKLTVVKAGADPVVLIESDGSSTSVPVPPVEIVSDTTGAGDAFAAGFLAATMGQATPTGAAEAGCRLAATVLTRPGAGS